MKALGALAAAAILPASCSGAAPVGAQASAETRSPRIEARVGELLRPEPAAPPAPAKAPPPPARALPPTVRALAPGVDLSTGAYLWDDEGVPPAPAQIVVDLAAQKIYVYRGRVQIGRSTINYGADDKPTPAGTFRILQKKRHHVSNLYGAPMPYMLRLTNDGIAIHESPVEDGAATHGCIGVPGEFAALLFAEARVGTRVVVTWGGNVPLA